MMTLRAFGRCSAALALVVFADAAQAQSLRGSRDSVDRMYEQAVAHGLHFYESPAGVRRAASSGRLERLSGDANYQVAGVNYPYVLSEVHTFVTRLAAQYRSACGEKLVVTSAMRPQSFQLSNSTEKSVHPTGMAVDLRKPTKEKCLSWLRDILMGLEGSGVLEATEERRPPHFHVALFPKPYTRYVQGRGSSVKLTSAKPSAGGDETRYRVRQGDSLWRIARKHGISVERIKQVNAMRTSRIVAGQTLVIPAR